MNRHYCILLVFSGVFIIYHISDEELTDSFDCRVIDRSQIKPSEKNPLQQHKQQYIFFFFQFLLARKTNWKPLVIPLESNNTERKLRLKLMRTFPLVEWMTCLKEKNWFNQEIINATDFSRIH